MFTLLILCHDANFSLVIYSDICKLGTPERHWYQKEIQRPHNSYYVTNDVTVGKDTFLFAYVWHFS